MKRVLLFIFLFFCSFVVTSVGAQSLAGLHVQGNKLVNQQGQVVKLRGVDRSGTEFMCIQGYGIFDGPHDQNSINAIKSWKTNLIRLPMNEDCWLNINGVKPEYGGAAYQQAIFDFVQLLNQNGFAVVLDLHWTAPGSQKATGQMPMPDMDHSPTFWTQVANMYKNNSMVIFDLFNEPYPDNNAWNSEQGWQCWQSGDCPNLSYRAAGLQTLVNAVRSTGSTNLITLGGIAYSDSLTQWLKYKPKDPVGNTIPSWHNYNFNYCNNINCWNTTVLPVAQQLPIIATEIGESDCTGNYINPLMNWMDGIGLHYSAWTWNNWNCGSGPALITDYTGTPTNYGAAYKAHLQ